MPRPMPISVPLTDLNLVPVPNLRFRVPCAVPGQGPRLKKVPVPFSRREKKAAAWLRTKRRPSCYRTNRRQAPRAKLSHL